MSKNNLPLSYIELSKKNLIHNIKSLQSITNKNTKIAVAIKGNAYGHGQNQIASILERYVDYFLVNSIEELELLRKVSKKKTFILGYVAKSDLHRLLKLNDILSVFTIAEMKEINKIAEKLKIKQEIHIPIDAYLGREGFLEEQWPTLFTELKKLKNLKFTGIYAHFANIEDSVNLVHAKKQIAKYEKAVNLAKEFGFKNLQTHISATSGLLVYENGTGINSIVRLGVGVYGMWPSEDIKIKYKNKIELHPVLSWKTKIAQIKTLPSGHSVGYGLTYKTTKHTKIAVIPQGYADGFDRRFSNNGCVLINGTRCKILGRISMNMFVVDINHLKNVSVEDEVVILGKQKKDEITAFEMAEKIGTINYEITTRISPLLDKIVV